MVRNILDSKRPQLILLLAVGLFACWSLAASAQDHTSATGDSAAGDTEHHAKTVPAEAHGETHADADGHSEDHGAVHASPVGLLPLWTAIPFAGILLSIALGPLVAPHF